MTTSSRSVSGPLAGAEMDGDMGVDETVWFASGLVDPYEKASAETLRF